MSRVLPSLILPALLAACAPGTLTGRPDVSSAPAAAAPTPEAVAAATAITRAHAPRPAARATPAQLDTTTAEQRAAAARPAERAETRLGTTIASLGNPSEPGFWIRTPLVTERAMGRIVNPATGKSAQVELIPLTSGGAGSQVSLPAMQLLGVPLTDLPRLEVYRS
ncbi:hypothetical protein KY389_04110 [Paracoccus bogoriensis]|uniref:hypothetical protein n=1 Tax=Paracoccus bogoriensis TaxID=242065 RepID=UPI001CA53C42|nr:hypothetical protein [Paracoccus bogoriensis]MBW7055880.1 hypothetical protein [Paracoccus bogoriensis]